MTGPAELIEPGDLPDGVDAEALRRLFREVFQAADARVVVLVASDRSLGIASA